VLACAAASALLVARESLAATCGGTSCRHAGCDARTLKCRVADEVAAVGAAQVPREFVLGTLRLSTGRHTTLDEVDRAVDLILAEARRQGVAMCAA
jgi:cysteine desulfurase